MDLKGKTAVVIGGTSGIGRASALMMAARGAEVIVVGRDASRGAEVEAALKAASEGLGSFIQADISLMSECRRVKDEIIGRVQKVDALVQSAGVIDFAPETTSEGQNKMFVTNFLHKYAMAHGLRQLLAAARGRMVFVAADVPDKQEPDWANFEGARIYGGIPSLPRLQAATLAMAQYLGARGKDEGIEVTAIHPGLVDTGIFRSAKGPWKLVKLIMSLFFVPVEKPAALVTWLAFSPEAQGLSGYFFPSIQDYGKRRLMQRSDEVMGRVMKVALAAMAPKA